MVPGRRGPETELYGFVGGWGCLQPGVAPFRVIIVGYVSPPFLRFLEDSLKE